ncbi:ribosomal protein L7/L12 [Pseudactinotalea sp.]|uniref:ribosomal protein L7/L12 n=1 Tax=Pseudactinotalea sp. TaxID=1926260 RepID=UPI003B3A91C7
MADQQRARTDHDLVEAFKELTLIDLSAFVKQFEDPYGKVESIVPEFRTLEDSDPVDPDSVLVTIDKVGDNKIRVISEVRKLTTLGLMEAKNLVEDDRPVLRFGGLTAARRAADALEETGAIVSIQSADPQALTTGEAAIVPPSDGEADLETSIAGRMRGALPAEVIARIAGAEVEGGSHSTPSELPGSSRGTAQRVAGLVDVMAAFTRLWDESLLAAWMTAPSVYLDGASPIDMIVAGRASVVTAQLEDIAYGGGA